MKKLCLFIAFCTISTTLLAQDPTYRQRLYYSCRVWGFVKYYHSRVSNCQVNWDSVLQHTLPLIKNAVTYNGFNDVLDTMLLAAGPMEIATTPSPDTLPPELKRNLRSGWINDPVFRDDVRVVLDTIKNNFRPHHICWVHSGTGTSGYLAFPYDDPAIDSNAYTNYPSEFTRLLILFKYWNILNYFNPYNYVQDTPWDSTLFNNVLSIDTVSNYTGFFKSIKKIAAACNDAHVEGLTNSPAYSSYYTPRIILRFVQNRYVVVKSAEGNLFKGDIIASIDGKTTEQWEDSLRPYISAGNPSVFRRFMCQYLLFGAGGSRMQIVYKDSLDIDHSLSTYRNYYLGDSWFSGYYPNDTLGTAKWKKWNCNIGYVNMGKLLTSEVNTMYTALKNTTSIIFDIRNYPQGTASGIGDLMYLNLTCFSKLALPNIYYPGTYYWYHDYLGHNGNTDYYQGKVIILCNQETQSAAEYSCMIFRVMPNSVVIGSQTAGTDGDCSLFHLSWEIQTGFTSLGVYYPNGDSTERIGIVPDSIVYQTSAGIRQGRDEVLEKALQAAGCLVPMLSVAPATRNVAAAAGTASFTVTSNTNWSAVSDTSWCKINSSGSGNGTIAADYAENTSYLPRTANIHVTVAGLPEQIVTLIQARSTNGVEEDQEIIYQIYPNPTKGKFRIIPAKNGKGIPEISVADVNGREILKKRCKEEQGCEIDLSSVTEGIYPVIIVKDNIRVVQKLVIIR